MKVTLKKLNSLGACWGGVKWFKKYKGDTELIPLVKKLIKVNVGWANWLITHYMTKSQCKQYINNPKIYNNADAYADANAYARVYSYSYASAYAHASAYDDAYAYVYVYIYAHASAYDDASAYKKKLTQIIKWGIKILEGKI